MANSLLKLPVPLLLAVAALCTISLSAMAWAFKASPVIAPVKPVEVVHRTVVVPPVPAQDVTSSIPSAKKPAPAPAVVASVFNPPPRVASDQKVTPARCGDDPDCLRRWFAEYKAMITDEFVFWRGFESDVANDDRAAATAALRAATDGSRYKHQAYDFYRGSVIADLRRDDLTALIDDCRAAVVNMAHLVADVSRAATADDSAPGHYLRNARNCEKQFKLPAFRSALRNNAAASR